MKPADFEDIIDRCRLTFGDPGRRKISWRDRLCYFNLRKPLWCDTSDDLRYLFKNKWEIFEQGHIVWCCIVQANVLLFEKGNSDCPASVVFCPDRSVNVSVKVLSYAASNIFALKGESPKNKELLDIANNVTDEYTRTFGVPVPKQFADGFELYKATTFIPRKYLPNRRLSRSLFPLIVTPNKPYYSFPLPSRYWPKQFVDYWQ